jgi:4-amino-4-deoxy-L-arabinose transferase-like glycosyltransferase
MTIAAAFCAICAAGLMYAAGRRLFGTPRWGIVTAGLFALTPLLWSQIQNAPASLYPLPFVAGWLWAAAHLEDARATWWAAAAGALLGLGVYTSTAAIVMMPLYLVLMLVIFAHARAIASREIGVCLAAFAVAVAPAAWSLLVHPEHFRDTVNAYHLYDADRFNVRQGIREMASWVGLTARSEVYYDYFNPAFLFLSGRVLLAPLIVLVPAGLYEILTAESTPAARLMLAGFLASPFAASLTAQAPTPGRMLFVTPFAAVLSAYGARRMLSAWRAWTNSSAGSPRPAHLPRP